ncbi:hypothetical protein [Rhizobium sp. 1399]|uniref:hypothetical protein n=1 Tax=Rhizobium sp. 1399 TaxID=2817758 RepID=UPI002865EF29|nr:hypothetical protein [Rhizobium sp. 1399]MDR6664033.1 hypothetical protein [Rhizobium sp. 1399]
MVLEYEVRTGIPADRIMNFTVGQLMARMRIRQDLDKVLTMNTARSVAVGMSGDEKAWETLTKTLE